MSRNSFVDLQFSRIAENAECDRQIGIESFELALDKMALICHYVDQNVDDENEHPEVLLRDYSRWRELCGKRFPNLGYYNIQSKSFVKVGDAEPQRGDALDDLADIANELSEFVWRSSSRQQQYSVELTARFALG